MGLFPCRCVVAPYDGSDRAYQAAELALELVEEPSGVHILHVINAIEPSDPGVIWAAVDDEERRKHALLALQKRFVEDRFEQAKLDIGIGDPGHVIVDLAEQLEADLIVIPSRGRSRLRRVLLGSVAERVLRLAHCPVLVLRD